MFKICKLHDMKILFQAHMLYMFLPKCMPNVTRMWLFSIVLQNIYEIIIAYTYTWIVGLKKIGILMKISLRNLFLCVKALFLLFCGNNVILPLLGYIRTSFPIRQFMCTVHTQTTSLFYLEIFN